MTDARVRTARPSDHPRIVAVCDDWWERPVAHILPRLFLDHFHSTSLVAERGGELAGFLVGFPSPSVPEEAYVHFAGVAPEHRRTGLASRLYRRFTDGARADGRTVVRAVTSPANERSIAFHRSHGFGVTGPHADYDGPGADRMVFTLRLGE
ncbi:GCN5 family acetyltransferase [Nocardiopsis sp. TSRI0078]|uniref:GNAT family N-acetyltransferase n=1 Tax=unclassified Nocardiopsis TaxID=2649073 RepID=UPI000938FE3E|nr:GNAT family N-acetyltransferase [Nocardiopsis sp. TSRI0078]OKI13709.1 GCN5 family acetyltransferase [Nocardiopsis sp. TSRI0078]